MYHLLKCTHKETYIASDRNHKQTHVCMNCGSRVMSYLEFLQAHKELQEGIDKAIISSYRVRSGSILTLEPFHPSLSIDSASSKIADVIRTTPRAILLTLKACKEAFIIFSGGKPPQ